MRQLFVVAALAAVSALALQVPDSATTTTGRGQTNIPLARTVKHYKTKSTGQARHLPSAKAAKSYNKNLLVSGDIWPISIYWATVLVGTPLKPYLVNVDSGSGYLYVPGHCPSCPANPEYSPAKSSTSHNLHKNFSATYETCNPTNATEPCTIRGQEFYDVASLAPGLEPVKVNVGVIDYQTSDMYQGIWVSGVMGMIGHGERTVFYQQCIKGNKCNAPTWAICFHEGATSNGTMTVGGVDERLSDGPIEYVPSTNATGWHEVNVHYLNFHSKKFSNGTHRLSNSAATNKNVIDFNISTPKARYGTAILDTGTNDMLLPDSIFKETKKAMCGHGNELKHCDAFFDNETFCATMSDEEVNAYPDLDLVLDANVTLKMTSRDYLLQNSPAASNSKQYCFGFSNGGGANAGPPGTDGLFIIGDTTMQNYYLVFELNRVGWGPVNKNTCGSL